MEASACRTDDPLGEYLDGLGMHLRNKRQRESFAMYTLGLLSDCERKSMEPLAARPAGSPEHTHAVHERLIRFLGASRRSDAAVRNHATHHAVEAMQQQGPIRAWIVDDTGFLKQGKYSAVPFEYRLLWGVLVREGMRG